MGVKYKREPFKLFTLEEYTDLLCELIPLLRPDIVIQRLFGISDWDLLIAPNWGLKKTQIQTYMEKEIERREIVQGSLYRAK
jgi:radical SAM superfamily enzyme